MDNVKNVVNQEDTLGGRLKKVRETYKKTQKEFAKKVGLSKSAYIDKEYNHAKLSFKTLQILTKELNVSLDWLFDGEGSMFKYDQIKGKEYVKNTSINITTDDPGIYENGPLKNGYTFTNIVVPSYAADNYFDEGWQTEQFNNLQFVNLPFMKAGKDETLRTFQISGESMTPHFIHGDFVVCRYVDKNEAVKSNKVYVMVQVDGSIVLKRVYNNVEKSQFVLSSDNRVYHPYSLEYDDVVERWLVEWCISSAFRAAEGNLIE